MYPCAARTAWPTGGPICDLWACAWPSGFCVPTASASCWSTSSTTIRIGGFQLGFLVRAAGFHLRLRCADLLLCLAHEQDRSERYDVHEGLRPLWMSLQALTYHCRRPELRALHRHRDLVARALPPAISTLPGKGVSPVANGMATAADWMSAASFISMAGLIAFLGYDGSVYLMGWTGGYVLLALLLAPYLRKVRQVHGARVHRGALLLEDGTHRRGHLPDLYFVYLRCRPDARRRHRVLDAFSK